MEGACSCRTLLPGVDLAQHGLQGLEEELAGPGEPLAAQR